MKRLPIVELKRLAFIWAEQDRSSLADCWPEGSKERAEATWQYEQLKAYRSKKWGKTKGEMIDLKSVKLSDIKSSKLTP